MNFAHVFTVIPVFGRDDVLAMVPQLLSDYPGLRIVVVDNGNPSACAAKLKALQGAQVDVVRCDVNRGGTGGFNAGMRFALEHANRESDFVWQLDDDAVPNAETLTGLLRTYDELVARGEPVACVGSAIVNEKGDRVIAECGAFYLQGGRPGVVRPVLAGAPLADHPNEICEVEYSAACSCLVPVSVLRKVGLWYEYFFIHDDDIEWGLRAIYDFGLKNFATTRSIVLHPPFVNTSAVRPWIVYFDMRNPYVIYAKYARWTFLLRFANLTIHAVGSFLLNRRKNVYFFYRLVWWDLLWHHYRTRDEIAERFSHYGW